MEMQLNTGLGHRKSKMSPELLILPDRKYLKNDRNILKGQKG